jgi:hypothetical protein
MVNGYIFLIGNLARLDKKLAAAFTGSGILVIEFIILIGLIVF